MKRRKLTEHFYEDELMCRCGCGTAYIQREALFKLEALRRELAQPVYLNSACRCPLHNRRVGGVLLSRHRSTLVRPTCAFDIRLYPGLDKRRVIDAAKKVGFKGIGINYKTFVHVDNRPTRARW